MDLWMCVPNLLIRDLLWRILLGFKVGPKTDFSDQCWPCFVFFFNYLFVFPLIISIINENALRNFKYKRRNLNEKKSNISLFTDTCFFFPLICFSHITFARSLAQIFRRDRYTYIRNIRNIFFLSFYTFEVITHFVVEENFLNKHLGTLFEYIS